MADLVAVQCSDGAFHMPKNDASHNAGIGQFIKRHVIENGETIYIAIDNIVKYIVDLHKVATTDFYTGKMYLTTQYKEKIPAKYIGRIYSYINLKLAPDAFIFKTAADCALCPIIITPKLQLQLLMQDVYMSNPLSPENNWSLIAEPSADIIPPIVHKMAKILCIYPLHYTLSHSTRKEISIVHLPRSDIIIQPDADMIPIWGYIATLVQNASEDLLDPDTTN